MSAPEFEFVIVHAARIASREAHAEALARTGDQVHALRAGYQASLARKVELSQWARGRRAPQLNLAAKYFFEQQPDLYPRNRAEADREQADARDKLLAEQTTIIPDVYTTEVRNGVSARVPARRWHT